MFKIFKLFFPILIGIRDLVFPSFKTRRRLYKSLIAGFSVYLDLEIVRLSIKHIFGQRYPVINKKKLTVLCVVKNGEEYIDTFMQHHIELGVEHFYFLDNGSTDQTINKLKKYKNVTILSTRLSFQTYHVVFKAYLRAEYGLNRWTIILDIDELFDYYDSSKHPLGELLNYLSEHSYNRLLVNMLDLFADDSLDQLCKQQIADLKAVYKYFDKAEYEINHHVTMAFLSENTSVAYKKGGIKATYFNYKKGRLHKFPLAYCKTVRECCEDKIHVPHANAKVADISGVLYHFQFTGSLMKRSYEAVKDNSHWNNSCKYKHFLSELQRNPFVNLKEKSVVPTELISTSQLRDCNLLHVSSQFKQYMKEHSI